ncbi:ATP-binding protein [Actinoplanes italicus]|uniref:ATP-binding protein n=1 Tax=Actinoplanes italicus TaxID=113567 RepID=UPI001945A7C1|nr:LuxR family transcriptional regulator [Actinoplanes italicus]
MDDLFGREAELSIISRFLRSVREHGGALLVRGESGIGKSALLSATAAFAALDGLRVLRAAGSEFEADVSYSFLNQLLLSLRAEVRQLPSSSRDALTIALGFGPGPTPAPPLIGDAVLTLLTRVAEHAPVLLIVDDVQWVDRASAAVLGLVAQRAADRPVGVVAAATTGTQNPLDRCGLTEVTVRPLTPDSSARLVDARLPTLPAQARQRLLDLAQGNPLALIELPVTLSGDDHEPDGRPDVVPLSERLQAVFAQRIASLPDATRRLLLLLTFEGSGDARVLGGMADLTALAPAERAELVRVHEDSGRVVFRHPLIRSAIVAMSTHEERRTAHLTAAGGLSTDPERRSRHLAVAASGPDEVVSGHLDEAAHRVLRQGDSQAAIATLIRAAELSATPGDRARRLAEAAYIGAEAGGSADATTLLTDAAATSPGTAGSLHAAAAAALLMINGDGDVHTAHRLLAGAIEAGDHGWRADDPALEEAMHTMVLLSWYAGTAEHWAVFRRAMERLTPHPPDVLSVLSRTFPDPVRTGADARADLEALISRLSEETDLTRIMRIGTASVYLDRLGDNREYSWLLIGQGREGGAPRLQLSALMHLCLDDFLTGRWEESEELAHEAQKLCSTSGLTFLNWYFLYNRAIVAAGRGRPGEAFELADEITHWALPRGVAGAVAIAHHPRALAAAAEGDFEAAFLHASAVSPPGVLAPYVPISTWVMFDLVEAALRTGRTAEARAHGDAMRSVGVAELSWRMRLIQHGVDALVLDTDEADAQLEETLADEQSARWVFEASRIRLAFAEKVRRRKDFARARTHLLAAHAGFDAMGAEPWLARTVVELRATGYRPVIAEQQPGDLTAQELEIARLAAGGLTNKQIAERLYLSHRTVGAHLYRIFPKLGVSSRAGLRDALSAHGPEDPGA